MKFPNDRLSTLNNIAQTAKHQGDLIHKRLWADVDWDWLERKMPTEFVDQLYGIAIKDDGLKF